MKLLKCLLMLMLASYSSLVYAQSPLRLDAEIQRLERLLPPGSSSSQERYGNLVRLAGLKQLSGDFAGAAENWLEAAKENPADEEAVISAASCYAVIGEWERAAYVLYPLLISTVRGPAVQKAYFLDACIKARLSGDLTALAFLASDQGFFELRPVIYFALWQLVSFNTIVSPADGGSAETWRNRLLTEFPKSPEARAVSGSLSGGIGLVFNPFWFFIPSAALSVADTPPERLQIESPSVQTPALGAWLQAGVFSSEANAQKQIDALGKAGFSGTINERKINGVDYWAVLVPAGSNSNSTIQELKRAGFDSFLLK